MKYIKLLIWCCITVQFSTAQIHEIGIYVGGSNFIGDVGSSRYIAPNQLAIGGLYKWNRSPRHSYRVSAIFTDLVGKDSKSDDPRRQQRDYEFKTSIVEFSAGMEFTFFDFDLHEGGHKSTPYLYSGVSVAKHDNFYFANGIQTAADTESWAYGIPMVIGFKTTLLDSFVLAAEIGARYTFSDELDGSMPDDEDAIPIYSFGNINNNDWYMFTGLTLTYTFGRNPCYCLY